MTVEERLEAMQKELDAWKRFTRWMLVPVVLIVAGAVVWGGFMKPVQVQGEKEVRAESFVVVDKRGKTRAVFSAGNIPRPGFNETHKDPAWLLRNHPHLAIFDPEGKPLAILGASEPHGEAAFQLVCGKDRLDTRKGFYFGFTGGTPYMEMVENSRVKVSFMLTTPDREPLLRTFNNQGKTTWSAPR